MPNPPINTTLPPSENRPTPDPNPDLSNPALFEEQHVHTPYTHISTHFSRTRHTPWPTPARFLSSRKQGSIGLDIGCGNGKYIASVPSGVYLVGGDVCAPLVSIAAGSLGVLEKGREDGGGRESVESGERGGARGDVVVADVLNLPHRSFNSLAHDSTTRKRETKAFDFALAIASLHHLSTRPRRIAAVREILNCVRLGGEVLMFVWAVEQGVSSRRRGLVENGEGECGKEGKKGGSGKEGEGKERGRDVMVPWVLQSHSPSKSNTSRARRNSKSRIGREKGDRKKCGHTDPSTPSDRPTDAAADAQETAQNTTRNPDESPRGTAHPDTVNQRPDCDDEQLTNTNKEATPQQGNVNAPSNHAQNGEQTRNGQTGEQNGDRGQPRNEPEQRYREEQKQQKSYNRYYHLYSSGELEEDVIAAGGEVMEGGWERDNWWVVCRPCLGLGTVLEEDRGVGEHGG